MTLRLPCFAISVWLALGVGCGKGSSSATPSPGDASVDGRAPTTDAATDGGRDATTSDATSDVGPCTSCLGDAGPGLVTSLQIMPPTATLLAANGMIVTQGFQAQATYAGGSQAPVTATWTVTEAAVGGIDANGLYTPTGNQGGVVTVTATVPGQGPDASVVTATATLTVEINQVDDQVTGGTPMATQTSLRNAALAIGDGGSDAGAFDPTIQWAYPYDNAVFPRGLLAPQLMWNNGIAGDVYYVRLSSPTYLLESFASAPVPSMMTQTSFTPQYTFTQALWAAFTNSTTGPAELTVARSSNGVTTVVTQQNWTIGSGSMSGTIYYWAINKAAVVSIKPGATTPTTFLSNTVLPLPDGGTAYTTIGDAGTGFAYCPSCHSISANGTMMAMSTGYWGATSDVFSTLYNLQSSTVLFNSYEQVNDPPSQFPLSALTPDGTVLVENWAPVRGMGAGQTDSPVDLSSPQPSDWTLPTLMTTNLETLVGSGHHTYFPAFSPDDELFVYVDSSSLNLIALSWDGTNKLFANPITLATGSAVPNTKIAYPTISPDHRWVIYQRGPDFGSLDTTYTGDLYAVDTQNPGTEIPLGTLNGVGYPFAAGAVRDADRDYEPTFAPVAAGGFFWVVFHSRRTYGNLLTGPAFTAEGSGTKQLWVAAIDITPNGADPSHEPFWLPGQDPTTLNMRGYWSLPPCAPNGQACSTGSDCCGGFCDETNDAGMPVCGKPTTQTCSNAGDHCSTTADCCDPMTSGLTCIGGVCTSPMPQIRR